MDLKFDCQSQDGSDTLIDLIKTSHSIFNEMYNTKEKYRELLLAHKNNIITTYNCSTDNIVEVNRLTKEHDEEKLKLKRMLTSIHCSKKKLDRFDLQIEKEIEILKPDELARINISIKYISKIEAELRIIIKNIQNLGLKKRSIQNNLIEKYNKSLYNSTKIQDHVKEIKAKIEINRHMSGRLGSLNSGRKSRIRSMRDSIDNLLFFPDGFILMPLDTVDVVAKNLQRANVLKNQFDSLKIKVKEVSNCLESVTLDIDSLDAIINSMLTKTLTLENNLKVQNKPSVLNEREIENKSDSPNIVTKFSYENILNESIIQKRFLEENPCFLLVQQEKPPISKKIFTANVNCTNYTKHKNNSTRFGTGKGFTRNIILTKKPRKRKSKPRKFCKIRTVKLHRSKVTKNIRIKNLNFTQYYCQNIIKIVKLNNESENKIKISKFAKRLIKSIHVKKLQTNKIIINTQKINNFYNDSYLKQDNLRNLNKLNLKHVRKKCNFDFKSQQTCNHPPLNYLHHLSLRKMKFLAFYSSKQYKEIRLKKIFANFKNRKKLFKYFSNKTDIRLSLKVLKYYNFFDLKAKQYSYTPFYLFRILQLHHCKIYYAPYKIGLHSPSSCFHIPITIK